MASTDDHHHADGTPDSGSPGPGAPDHGPIGDHTRAAVATADHLHGPHGGHGQHQQTQAVLNRLARTEGHLRAVRRMVDEGRDCSEVLIQLAAVRSAVDRVARVVLEDHVESCLRRAASNGTTDQEWDSLKTALDRFIS